jgi:hypothetical protein
MSKDDNKVVKLRQPPAKVAGVGVDDAIMPKSFLNMTQVEQDMFLQQLRDRRLKAAKLLKEAHIAKRHTESVNAMLKIDKKSNQVTKQLEKAIKALDVLDVLLYDLRTITLQHTDIDITKVDQ